MPVSLEILNLSASFSGSDSVPHKFSGGLPAEWGSMTNLKELKMYNCGLDGESVCSDIPHRSELRSESRAQDLCP